MEQTERWRDLCQEAVNEPDPKRLMILVKEINELLEAGERDSSGEPAELTERKPPASDRARKKSA